MRLERRKGNREKHITKYGVIIIPRRDRHGWECKAEDFLTKIVPTIKEIKRNDLPPAKKGI